MGALSVGLNLHFLVKGSGGAGTYARQLVPALRAVEPDTRLVAFVSREAGDDDLDALRAHGAEVVRFPVAVTHGNRFAIDPNPRNKPDEVLRAVAASGGVIGATPYGLSDSRAFQTSSRFAPVTEAMYARRSTCSFFSDPHRPRSQA